MRLKKWISALIVLALLCAVIPMGMAEEEIVVELADEVEATDSGEDVGDDSLDVEILIDEDSEDKIPGEALLLEIDEADLEADKTGSDDVIEAAPAVATNDNSDFEIDEDGVLVRYKGFDKNVVIPNSVKVIGSEAFEDDTQLESVTIPSSVTYIGYGAFYGCTGLKSITIPDSVTETGSSVLSGCTSLTSVQLSSKLTELASSFFSDCNSLKAISIPSGIKTIGSSAFSSCDSLTTVSIPGTVTTIGSNAFLHCESMKTITLPNGVVSIGDDSFGSCYALESITIPASVTSIDRGAFNGSNNVIIRGTAGSYAEKYANGMGIPFNAPVVSFNETAYSFYDEDTDIDYTALILYANQTRTLKTVQKPSDLATTLKWSSSNTKVATVDSNGKVKGIAKGTATITAATANGKGKAAQIQVFVPEPTSIDIRWEEDDDGIAMGKTYDFSAYKHIPYSYETEVDMPVSWSVSDKTILSVVKTWKDSEGEDYISIKGLKPGKATLTATTPDGGKATVTVKVYRPEPEDITINQLDPIVLKPGKKTTLTATVTPSTANSKVTWTSDDTSVAKVNKKGVVTAVAEGWATIRAETVNEHTAYFDVYVYKSALTLKKTKITLGVKETFSLKSLMSAADAKIYDYCSSGDSDIVTISSKGVATAWKKGKAAVLIRTYDKKGRIKAARIVITVKPAPKSVDLYKGSTKLKKNQTLTLKKGKTLQLKAKLNNGAASALKWSSSKKSVATVSQSGKVTAKGKGTTTITVKTFNKRTMTLKITVK